MKMKNFDLICYLQGIGEEIWLAVFLDRKNERYGVEETTQEFPNFWEEPLVKNKHDSFKTFEDLIKHLSNRFDLKSNKGFVAAYHSAAFEGEDLRIFKYNTHDGYGYSKVGGSCFRDMIGKEFDSEDYSIARKIDTIEWNKYLRIYELPETWSNFNHVWFIGRFGEHLVDLLGEQCRMNYWKQNIKSKIELIPSKDAIKDFSMVQRFAEASLVNTIWIGEQTSRPIAQKVVNFFSLNTSMADPETPDINPKSQGVIVCKRFLNSDPEHEFYEFSDFSGKVYEVSLQKSPDFFTNFGAKYFGINPVGEVIGQRGFSSYEEAKVWFEKLAYLIET